MFPTLEFSFIGNGLGHKNIQQNINKNINMLGMLLAVWILFIMLEIYSIKLGSVCGGFGGIMVFWC